MATKAKSALVAAFLRLVEREPYEKITVTELVEECAISRQTFYYHFNDIEDMLEWAFNNETEKICKNAKNTKWSEASRGYIDFMNKYDTLLRKATVTKDIVLMCRFLYNSFYKFIETYIVKKQGPRALDKEETKFFIVYNASAFCGLIMHELRMEESDYERLYEEISSSFKILDRER